MHIRKLPARAFSRPGIRGWVCHVQILCVHFGLLHLVITVPMEPTALCQPVDCQPCMNGKTETKAKVVTETQ